MHPLQTDLPCGLHSIHSPKSHINHWHHIWPSGWGGPDVAKNRVVICPTGHYNVHELLDLYLGSAGDVPWELRQHWGWVEREYALMGWQARLAGELVW